MSMDIRDLWDAGNPEEPDGFAMWGGMVTDELTMHVVDRHVMARRSDPATWQEIVFTTDVSSAITDSALTIEHGRVVGRAVGGTGARSNRRVVYKIPDSPGGYSRVRSRILGTPDNPAATGTMPQRGHAHGIQQVGGVWVAVVAWHDIFFNQGQLLNLGAWSSETAADGVGFVPAGGTVVDSLPVTAAVRSSNVVTLTVASGHPFVKGDVVVTDLADNSYDGTFTVTSVGGTTVVYGQTAANAGTSTGTVRLWRANTSKDELIRSTAVTASSRTSGLVTATVAAGHPWRTGDEIAVDLAVASYDGVFKITDATSSPTQIKWRQAAADDAAGGAGTITNMFPYYMESEWWPGLLRARVWPGHDRTWPPSWESNWSVAANISAMSVAEPNPDNGIGAGLVFAHPTGAGFANATEIAYDSVATAALSV